MAPRRSTPKEPEHAQLTAHQMGLGVRRLEAAISDVDAFNPTAIAPTEITSKAGALSAAVKGALEQTFGHGTVEYRRYGAAATFAWPLNYRHPTPHHEVQAALVRCREHSLALLREAATFLR
jgi:hypothetical protein